MAIRANIFQKHDTKNPLGTFMAVKEKGYRDVQVELTWAISDLLAAGEAIEYNVLVGAHEGDEAPAEFFRQSFTIKESYGYQPVPAEYKTKFHFAGFPTDKTLFTVLIERRNDIDPAKGTNSPVEFVVIRNALLSHNPVT